MSFLTHHVIDIPALLAEVESPGCGAAVLFLGTVRRSPEDGEIAAIEYSAYESMAERELAGIVAEAEGKWPGMRIALAHRLGHVPTGEASVAIAVALPHRAEAYDASRFVIEELKKRVPIWKKELVAHG